MQHRVPPERAWRDKVMVICYAYRPHQTLLRGAVLHRQLAHDSLDLAGRYNCYAPPRNAREFREFAERMPSHR